MSSRWSSIASTIHYILLAKINSSDLNPYNFKGE